MPQRPPKQPEIVPVPKKPRDSDYGSGFAGEKADGTLPQLTGLSFKQMTPLRKKRPINFSSPTATKGNQGTL